MAKVTDQILAARMLESREQGGYRLGLFLRINAKGYAFIVLYFAAVLGFLAFVRAWSVFAAVASFVIGVFLRDVVWLIGARRSWAFSRKVIDWDKVKRAADGET